MFKFLNQKFKERKLRQQLASASEFWVLNNSQELGEFGQVVINISPPPKEVEDNFPWPRDKPKTREAEEQYWELQHKIRDELFLACLPFNAVLVIPANHNAHNVLLNHSRQQLLDAPDFWRAINKGLITVSEVKTNCK